MKFLRLRPVLAVTLFALVAVLAGCGGRTEGAQGAQAPSFSVSTGEDSSFSLDEHSGEVVLLYFSFPG